MKPNGEFNHVIFKKWKMKAMTFQLQSNNRLRVSLLAVTVATYLRKCFIVIVCFGTV